MWCSPTARSSPPARHSHPDLFWALRGGGGNFGIVTSFTFRCHDIGEHGTIIGGPVLYDFADTAEVMRWYRELLPSLPEELSGWIGLITIPPAPPFPEAAVGPQGVRHRLVLHRSARPGRRGARAGQDLRLAAAGGPAAHAVRRAAERVRRPLPGRAAVVLAGRLLQRDLRRGDRRAHQVRRAAADRPLHHAHVPHRRRRQPRARRRDRLRLPRRRLGRHHRGRRPRPGQRRPHLRNGPGTTGRNCTRPRPAAPTSTS